MWNPKKDNSQKQRVEWWLQGLRQGKWDDVGQRVYTPSYQMNKFLGSDEQRGDYS